MKKIAYLAIAFVMGVFTSCTDKEEVEITKHHNLTLNISTQNMYDQFDLTYTIRETHLRDGGKCVGVMTYIYNSEGNLVRSSVEHLPNFNLTTLNIDNLAEGRYTIIAIETLLNPEDDYKADTWSFDDVEKIATIKITEKLKDPDENGYRWSKVASEAEVIGVSIQEVDLHSNLTLDIVPKGIGSVIRFNQFNWEKSPYAYIGWSTDHVLNYYSLNPSLSKNDRYVKHVTGEGKTHVRGLYEVDDDPTKYYGAYVLEPDMDWKSVWITLEDLLQSKTTDESNTWHATLEDGQRYQIGCYYGSNGIYNYFGDETGLNSWKSDKDKTVGPPSSSTLFEEPYTNWSVGTISAVKSYMSGFTLYQDIEYSDNYNAYSLGFRDDSGNDYDYVFTTTTSGLTDVYVWPNSSLTLNQVREEVAKQGYTYNSQNNNNYYYTGNSTYVTVYQTSSGSIFVNYYNPSAYGLAPKFEIPMYPIDFGNKGVKGNDKNNSLSSVNVSLLNPYLKKVVRKAQFK